MKKFLKQKKGITLIALVITIIVLLILAGISISMITGENGILQKTTTAKENTERAEIIEIAQTDIAGKQIENNGLISEMDLYEILTSEDYNTQGTIEGDANESILDAILISKDGKYEIRVDEIYDGNFSEEEPIAPELIPSIYGFMGPENVFYGFDPGMKWVDWINSSYNINSFSIQNVSYNSVPVDFRGIEGVWANGWPLIDANGNFVLSNDTVGASSSYSNAMW